MPFKAKAACRRHIAKQRHRVTNWAEYDAGLRARGSLTVWFTPEAVAAWAAAPRTTRGGQASYSDLAIATALTLRAVFRLALRQTEGLIGSVLQLLDLDLGVPVATEPRVRLGTLARRGASVFRRKPTFDARQNIGRRKAESYGPVVHQLMHLSLASNPPGVFG